MNTLWAAALATALLTPAQTLDRRAIGELAFSPDGTRLVFTVTDAVHGTTRARSIWLLDVASGRSRQLTFSGKSDSSPRWSPDGRAIAFLSDRDGAAQLYLLRLDGGEADKLTDRSERISEFRWSRDGTRIALLMPDAKLPEQQARERDKDDARRVEKDERRPRVWMLDVATRTLVAVTSGPWRIAQIEWLPDGRHLVAVADATPASDRWTAQIHTIDVTTGAVTPVASPRGPFGGLDVSRDGATLAFVGARVDGPEPHDMYIVRLNPDATRATGAASAAPTNVTAATLDRPVSQLHWVDDHTVAGIVARGFGSALALIGTDGAVRDIATPVNPTTFARAGNGTIAFAGETATRAPELWIKPPTGDATAVTTLNEKWTSVPLVAPEVVKYRSFDGKDIEAALLRPTNSGSGTPGPFVVLVHGGPTGRWSDAFEPWGQLLVQRGYAVLYPNVRGSTGYGEAFVEANRADWGGGDFKDVMAGVDWAIARGIADPARLGIGGWSYGGYMAAWAVTQTTRFKAAVSGAPVIDMASEFGTEDSSAYDEWFYGTPYERPDGFVKSSPMTYVKHAKTPTLLLQGEDDETDPIGQSQQFYRGLKRYGVEAEFVRYPREPHGLREEKHLLDRLTRILAWYDRYLKPSGGATSPQP
ncbi:MAG TPA: S9 family peptidase [Vicinamibacterales bacterium]|nr:S9 family peptidase [Vicinamibacterales bacterium]